MSVLRTDIGDINDIALQLKSIDNNPSTYAGRYLARYLKSQNQSVVSRYDLYLMTLAMYASDQAKSLYLRDRSPSLRKLDILTTELQTNRHIARIGSLSLFTVLGIPAPEVTDAVCQTDRYCSVAYLSAMQRWGLSERNPNSLIMHRPSGALLATNIAETVKTDADHFGLEPSEMLVHPLKSPSALEAPVWQMPITLVQDNKPRDVITLRGSNTRISSLPQTLIDTITKPELCGGMAHIMDVWSTSVPDLEGREVKRLLEGLEISTQIVKVRAGYLLDEYLGLSIDGVDAFLAFAQRGGSRVLDPQKPFASTYSEKWMLSLNV